MTTPEKAYTRTIDTHKPQTAALNRRDPVRRSRPVLPQFASVRLSCPRCGHSHLTHYKTRGHVLDFCCLGCRAFIELDLTPGQVVLSAEIRYRDE